MIDYKELHKEKRIAIVGLGYVGLPLAIAFDKKSDVIGFDLNKEKINLYKNKIDPTGEVGSEAIRNCNIHFTSNPEDLREANFIIVAVPTPIDKNNNPDLRPVETASRLVGKNLTTGTVVVFESTVYPGVTEDICAGILEEESGFRCGVDFKIGYSPERINPGDKTHRLESIIKVVSGIDNESLDIIAKTYEMVIEAGVYKASSIKVAEAAKVIENSQRDINIAFVNELSIIFDKMGIDTKEVLQAAGTKWNFLNFTPGLVGGHCIGVDPYYLTFKAAELGYKSQVILAGRHINDGMGKYIAEKVIKLLIKDDKHIKGAKVLVKGITFKEDVPDVRNSKVVDIIDELKDYGVQVFVEDPWANNHELKEEYGIELEAQIPLVDAVILAVGHSEYLKLTLKDIKSMLKPEARVFVDVKGIFDKDEAMNQELVYWRL